MVFHSSQNSFNSHGTQAESFNSYNVSNSGYDYQPALRPQGKDYMFPTAVHSMISNYDQNELKYLNHDTMRSREELSGNGMHSHDYSSEDELVGEGFFKKARKSIRKTANKHQKLQRRRLKPLIIGGQNDLEDENFDLFLLFFAYYRRKNGFEVEKFQPPWQKNELQGG